MNIYIHIFSIHIYVYIHYLYIYIYHYSYIHVFIIHIVTYIHYSYVFIVHILEVRYLNFTEGKHSKCLAPWNACVFKAIPENMEKIDKIFKVLFSTLRKRDHGTCTFRRK